MECFDQYETLNQLWIEDLTFGQRTSIADMGVIVISLKICIRKTNLYCRNIPEEGWSDKSPVISKEQINGHYLIGI